MGGLGRPRYLFEFVEVAKGDSKGRSHPDGWGYAVAKGNGNLEVFKTLYPIWERPLKPPSGRAFILHVRRAEKLGKSLEHVQPHLCNGVALAHNGGLKLPLESLSGFNLAYRSSSERLACLFGRLVERFGTEKALEVLSKRVKPKPSANFLAIVPSESKLVVYNHHSGDPYYVMWRKGNVFSSEPLGEGWEPLSEKGAPAWEVLSF